MRQLSYIELPLTEDPRQVFTVDLTIDGAAFHARLEVRYLSAPDQWIISIWDRCHWSDTGPSVSGDLYIAAAD